MGTERFNFIFQQYPEKVMLSKAQKPKLWKMSQLKQLSKPSLALLDSKEYEWRVYVQRNGKSGGLCLWDNKLQSWVIKNAKVVGTPREQQINGQYLWSGGKGSEHYNRAVKAQLTAYYVPALVRQNIEQIVPEGGFKAPLGMYIQFEYIFFFPFVKRGKVAKDYINLAYLYMKVFEDTLQEQKWLPDDSPQYVRGGYIRYIGVETEEERRLEIKVHFCYNNQRIG